MLVLDEQLLGRDLDTALAHWYRGAILFITDLRPNTVIKDDAIPVLLRQQHQPTFLTINATDFWRTVDIDARFCVICFPLPDAHADVIPALLRAVFHIPAFRSKARRMGTVLRVTHTCVHYGRTGECARDAGPLASSLRKLAGGLGRVRRKVLRCPRRRGLKPPAIRSPRRITSRLLQPV